MSELDRLEIPCPTCGGDGKAWDGEPERGWSNICPACHGEKVVPESDAAYIERMKRVIDELAKHIMNVTEASRHVVISTGPESKWMNFFGALEKAEKAACLKAAKKATVEREKRNEHL